MQGIKRRVVYVTLYEGIAICISSLGLLVLAKGGLGQSAPLAVATSTIAVIWNVIYNGLFERWEAWRGVRGRSVGVRVLHAIGFEGGLALMFIPLIAWWLGVPLWQGFVASISMLVFFLIYTFVFTWGFDKVFGLPASARAAS